MDGVKSQYHKVLKSNSIPSVHGDNNGPIPKLLEKA